MQTGFNFEDKDAEVRFINMHTRAMYQDVMQMLVNNTAPDMPSYIQPVLEGVAIFLLGLAEGSITCADPMPIFRYVMPDADLSNDPEAIATFNVLGDTMAYILERESDETANT